MITQGCDASQWAGQTFAVLVKNSSLATDGFWRIEWRGYIFGGGTLTWWWGASRSVVVARNTTLFVAGHAGLHIYIPLNCSRI
jgi:hypothetical protein